MHCASCELLIEQELSAMPGVTGVEASMTRGEVDFEYVLEKPSVEQLNDKFKAQNYVFSEQPFAPKRDKAGRGETLLVALAVIAGFLVLNDLGLASFARINSDSSLAAFFVFGLIAGVSSCAALIGGLVLSFSSQWSKGQEKNGMKPHLLFNGGRLISFALLGALLGLVGEKFTISPTFTSLAVLIVSLLMLILALQMLGIASLDRFRIALPKSISRRAVTEKPTGERTPFMIGFLTILLPCGFTVVAEGAAILAGSPVRSSMIMLSFVLGTTLPLLFIGLGSNKLLLDRKMSGRFLKVAGILIIFFVSYNLNTQFGFTRSLQSDAIVSNSTSQTVPGGADDVFQSIPNDIQLIKAVYTLASDIQPNTFEVKKGKPVRFEVEVKDNGSGCMSTIMIPGLWDKALTLKKGKTLVMEFTPSKSGDYEITCAMGVPRGTLKVID